MSVTASRASNNSSIIENGTDGVSVYPNPTTGIANLDLTGLSGSSDVMVTDINGRVILSTTVAEGTSTIDLSGNAKGIYIINIVNGDSKYTNKVVLQ
jgi:hypothetical protein